MEAVPFSDARAHLTEIVNQVQYGGKRYLLSRSGKSVAVIISLQDYQTLEAWEDQMDLKAAQKADREIQKSGTLSWEKAKKELGI